MGYLERKIAEDIVIITVCEYLIEKKRHLADHERQSDETKVLYNKCIDYVLKNK